MNTPLPSKPHQVPDMTDPQGQAWDQPSRDKILVDDYSALMQNATFEQLKNYSTSIPSGVYEGKMWRRQEGTDWLLCWFGPSDTPNSCSINTRKIIISDRDSFEVGKCYEHTSGQQLHICGKVSSVLYGAGLMAETGWNRAKLAERTESAAENKEPIAADMGKHEFVQISGEAGAAINYKRITLQVYIDNNFSN